MLSELEIRKMLKDAQNTTITPENDVVVLTTMKVLKEVLEFPDW